MAIVAGGVTLGALWIVRAATAPVQQPIAFSHALHAGTLQLDCQFCHRAAARAPNAGVPPVEQCMFCHSVVTAGDPEIAKVRQAFASGEPVAWQRVHRVPDHTRFLHEAHVRAGITCATCHGQVERMAVVRQVRALNMGDCVGCHRQYGARTDCTVCHY
jgi:hypothetical protein